MTGKPAVARKARAKHFVCPKTGQKFADEAACAQHHKAQAQLRRAAARRKKLEAQLIELVDRPRLTARTVSDVAQHMVDVLPALISVRRKLGLHDGVTPVVKHVLLKMTGPWAPRLNEGNYNAPLDTEGVLSQLRLRGTMYVVYSRAPAFFTQASLGDCFPFLHTGCGGANRTDDGYVAHYDLTLCLDDFPKIREAHEAWEAASAMKKDRDAAVATRAASLLSQSPAVRQAQKAFDDSQAALVAAQQALEEAAAQVEALKLACQSEAEAELPFDEVGLRALRNYIS